MLRILRDDVKAHRVILIIQGLIVAEWADVLERECMKLGRSGLRVALDLSGVVFIGRAGLAVLGRLDQAGVEIMGCSPLIADMLEQEGIEVGRNIENANDEEVPWKGGGGSDA